MLGLIPLGTGNDFARGSEIPLDAEDAAQVRARTGRSRPVDLIVDDAGGIVVNNVHVGAGAQASRKSHRWKERLGAIGVGHGSTWAASATRSAPSSPPSGPPFVRLRVEVDGEVRQRRRPAGADGGARQRRPTSAAAPSSTPTPTPSDGLIDVDDLAVRSGRSPATATSSTEDRQPPRARRRRPRTRLAGSSITGDRFYCSADGEVSGPVSRRSWRIERAAFAMIVPVTLPARVAVTRAEPVAEPDRLGHPRRRRRDPARAGDGQRWPDLTPPGSARRGRSTWATCASS